MTNFFNNIASNRKKFQEAKPNHVVIITSTFGDEIFFSTTDVDSGFEVPIDHQVVNKVELPVVRADLLQSTTRLPTASVVLVDFENVVMASIMEVDNFIMGATVDIYSGFSKIGMDFSEYRKETRMTVTEVKNDLKGKVSLKLQSFLNFAVKPAFVGDTSTKEAITDTFTGPLNIKSRQGFPDRGYLLINGVECVYYFVIIPGTPSVGDSFYHITNRGLYRTEAIEHGVDAVVSPVFVLTGNPIDLILELLISTSENTGGTYDTLFDGAGIPESEIDLASFEEVRLFFPNDIFQLFIGNVENLLTWIDEHLLKPNNIRFIFTDKIALVIFKDSALEDSAFSLTEKDIINVQGWSLKERNIKNRFDFKWSRNPAGEYLISTEIAFADSVENYGDRPEIVNLAGASLDQNGLAIVLNRINRRADNLSEASAEFTVIAQTVGSTYLPADIIEIQKRFMPSPGNSNFYFRNAEVLENDYHHDKGFSKIKFRDSPFRPAITVGNFMADPVIVNILDGGLTIKVMSTEGLQDTDNLIIVDYPNAIWYDADIQSISVVDGVTLTVSTPFINASIGLNLAPPLYEFCTKSQKDRGCFFSDGDNDFADGRSPYVFSFG